MIKLIIYKEFLQINEKMGEIYEQVFYKKYK